MTPGDSMPTAFFEPCGGERWRNPFPMYQQLRDEDPVHHVPDNGEGEDYFVLSRFKHVFGAAEAGDVLALWPNPNALYAEIAPVLVRPHVRLAGIDHARLAQLQAELARPWPGSAEPLAAALFVAGMTLLVIGAYAAAGLWLALARRRRRTALPAE